MQITFLILVLITISYTSCQSAMTYVLIGGVTHDSMTVKAYSKQINPIILKVNNNTVGNYTNESDGFYTIEINNLNANTIYLLEMYTVTGSLLYTREVKTFPTPGSFAPLKFAASSNVYMNTKVDVYNKIFAKKPEMFLLLGNIHDEAVSNPKTKNLYTNTNFVYFFNENDFAGEDNSNANSNAVSAINLAYRKAFPTYDLPSQGIYQSFKYGSVLFLMTDSRTFLDTGKGFLFGTTQVNWLIEKLKAAANDTATSAVFITITQPWNYVEEAYDRDYIKQNFKSILQGVANEKTAVGETIRQNFNFNQPNSPNFKPVILIVGERALSFDDGSFNNFGSFPIVVCGPLDYWQQCRGGPYSHGSFHDSVGQYCVFDVYQHSVNNNTCVKMTGIISENEKREKDQPVFIYDTCAPHLYKARVNLKCPILWTEKIVAAAITIAVIFVVWIVFFVIIYRASVNALRFKHLKDA